MSEKNIDRVAATEESEELLAQEQAEHQQRIELEAQQEEDDLKWLMSHKQGRRIVWRQLERFGVFRLSYNENPLHMAFLEGCRNEGLRLLNLINEHCLAMYFEMVKENHDS